MAIVQLCMYLLIRDTTYYLTPASILPKAYSNSLFVLLNNRNVLRRQQGDGVTVPSLGTTSSQGRRGIQVNIAQESFMDNQGVAMVNLRKGKVPSSQYDDKHSFAQDTPSDADDYGLAK